jgi:carbon storage regulator
MEIMLVLSRKTGEKVVIGDKIEVTVLQVRGDRVKLGFSAPEEVAIHRRELRERVAGARPAPQRTGYG